MARLEISFDRTMWKICQIRRYNIVHGLMILMQRETKHRDIVARTIKRIYRGLTNIAPTALNSLFRKSESNELYNLMQVG